MADAQGPPASGGSKTFGIHKQNPEYRRAEGEAQTRENKRRGYEDKYEDDALGEELGNEARIWRVMLDEGRVQDAAMLQRYRDHLDVDLVFAGLFSAVLTTFVAQTSQTSSDTNDITVALLVEIIAIQRAWANNPRVVGVPSFSLPSASRGPSPWINRFWFLSLIFSLLAAFGAVVVRQWLQEYESDIIGPPKQRALVRHHRRGGLTEYKVHLIVPVLPMLLHVSLLLFFVGLTLYVRQFDRSMSNGIIGLTVTIYLLYLVTNILPVFLPDCPYRSPLFTFAHWVKIFIMLLHSLLRRQFTVKLPHQLVLTLRLCWMSVSIIASWLKQKLLPDYWTVLKENWNQVIKTPSTREWEAVERLSQDLIPKSLDYMVEVSSDLSVTPLVVQATTSLSIDPSHYDGYDYEDSRYNDLLRNRILPWFTNALTTRRTVFDWAPGRKNELQRMACSLLLVPHNKGSLGGDLNTDQYRICVSRVLQALIAALSESSDNGAEGDVATLSMTLLALGNRLDDLDSESELIRGGALWGSITLAYSSLPARNTPAVLRLQPVAWPHALIYLRYCMERYRENGGRQGDDLSQFGVALLRSLSFAMPPRDIDGHLRQQLLASSRLTLQQWLYLNTSYSRHAQITAYHLLCPQSCKSHHRVGAEPDHAVRLHIACHAIDSYVKKDGVIGNVALDDQLGFLAMHFVGSLVVVSGYGPSIDSALDLLGYSAMSSLFKSTFLARPGPSLVEHVKDDVTLPSTLAISLFWFLVKLAKVSRDSSGQTQAVRDIITVLDRHATKHHEVLANPLNYYDVIVNPPHLTSLGMHYSVVEELLENPQLAFLVLCDALAASIAVHLKKQSGSSDRQISGADKQQAGTAPPDALSKNLIWCILLDVLCTARSSAMHSKTNFSGASLHSTLLSLKKDHHSKWTSELKTALTEHFIPLSLALALNSACDPDVLAELAYDVRSLVKDTSAVLKVRVPDKTREGDNMDWYHRFTVNPEKHILIGKEGRVEWLPISEIVSLEKYHERTVEAVDRANAEGGEENVEVDLQEEDADDGAQVEGLRDRDNGAGREAGEGDGGEDVEQGGIQASAQAIGGRIAAGWKWLNRFMPFRRAGPRHEQGTELPVHQGRDGLNEVA